MTRIKLTIAGCAMALGAMFAASAPAQALPASPMQTQETAGGLNEGVVNAHSMNRKHRHKKHWRYGHRHCHHAGTGHPFGFFGFNQHHHYCHRHRTRSGISIQFNL